MPGVASIDIVRSGGSAGSFVVDFVAADGTARNGLNYQAVSGNVTFGEGEAVKTVAIPIIDDGVFDGNKTVNLYLSNPTLQAPLGTSDRGHADDRQHQSLHAPPDRVAEGPARLRPAHAQGPGVPADLQPRRWPPPRPRMSRTTAVLTPANKYQPKRTIAIAQAVLDPGGTVVTLYRLANDRVHLSKSVRIIVRGRPLTGLTDTAGTYLGGVNGQAGTDADWSSRSEAPARCRERDRGRDASSRSQGRVPSRRPRPARFEFRKSRPGSVVGY